MQHEYQDGKLYDCTKCPLHRRLRRGCRYAESETVANALEALYSKEDNPPESNTCKVWPLLHDSEVMGYIADYPGYAKGILRRAGGLNNQHATWVLAMRTMSREHGRIANADKPQTESTTTAPPGMVSLRDLHRQQGRG